MKDFPADMPPNFPNESEIELVHFDIHRAMSLGFEVNQESGYKKRHKERLAKIKEIENEDHRDFNETSDKICLEKYGCSALDYVSGKLSKLPK